MMEYLPCSLKGQSAGTGMALTWAKVSRAGTDFKGLGGRAITFGFMVS